MSGRPPLWTEERIACLRHHWRAGTPRSVIAKALGIGWRQIVAKAAVLDLGPLPALQTTSGYVRSGGYRLGSDLRHRAALGFSNPIRLQPPRSLFGAPIRVLDPATQALIDAALAERARP